MKRLLAATIATLASGGAIFFGATASSASVQATTQVIHAHGFIAYPSCPSGSEPWGYFVINNVSPASLAPSQITVGFQSDPTAPYKLLDVSGKAAKYEGPAPSKIISGTAVIYSAWSGQFVLSHYFCSTPSTTTTTPTTATTAPPDTVPSSTTTTPTTQPKHDGGTTTTVAPTTTTTTAHTSSGQGTTTTTVKPTTTTTVAKVTKATVADNTTTTVAKATPAPAAAAHSALAFTGSRTTMLLSWAFGLLMMGGLLVLSSRRMAPKRN